jgi:ribosome-binding factor A
MWPATLNPPSSSSVFLATPTSRSAAFKLNEHRIRIQGLVARAVVLKFTPTLKFVFDDSIVRGNKVLQIIEELEKSAPADSGPTEEP